MHSNRTAHLLATSIALASLVGSSIGCGMIRPVSRPSAAPARSGFLGDYAELRPREGYEAQAVYVKPSAPWSSYHAIQIDSVTLWIKDPSKAPSQDDAQMLTDTSYKVLSDKLGETFTLADHAGPGVLRIRAALTEAKSANVPLNAATTVVPQLRALSAVSGLASDTAVLVGEASGELEILDSVTNERLAAGIDSLSGTKGVTRAFSKWADVENACSHWAERARDFLVKQGVRTKSAGAR